MPGILLTRGFLDDYEPPDLPDGFDFFTVAHSELLDPDAEGDDVELGWIEDRTRVTDDPAIAFAWAVLLAGMVDDGDNPQPLARVTAYPLDPLDVADWEDAGPAEHVVVYVTEAGESLTPGDDGEGDALHAQVADWPELHKTLD
jgi:hypothetical protein